MDCINLVGRTRRCLCIEDIWSSWSFHIKPLTVQFSSQRKKTGAMNTGWSGCLYFFYKNTKFWCEHLEVYMKTIDSIDVKSTGKFILCSEKHWFEMPLCIVLFNPLQKQNYNPNCNAEGHTHVKGRWPSCSSEFGLSKLSELFAIID